MKGSNIDEKSMIEYSKRNIRVQPPTNRKANDRMRGTTDNSFKEPNFDES
jgi:hypothetical protein